MNVRGEELPQGEECYRCFDTRRRIFPAFDMAALVQKRQEQRELDDKFHEYRMDRVRGLKKFGKEQEAVVERIIKQENKQFVERYEEGTFFSLLAFAEKHHIRFNSEEELKRHIGAMGFTIIADTDGSLGVEVMDAKPGQYRIRRGKADVVTTAKAEVYESKDMQEERFEQLKDKLFEAEFGPSQPIGDLGRNAASASTQPTHPPTTQVMQDGDDAGAHEEDSDACGEEEDDDDHLFETPRTKQTRGRSLGPSMASFRSRSSTISGRSAARSAMVASSAGLHRGASTPPSIKRRPETAASLDTGHREGDDMQSERRKRKKCSSQVVTDSVHNLLAKTEAQMSWAAHWESKGRRRDFDALIGRLSSAGRRCGAFLADEAAMAASQRCFDAAEKLESRQQIFDLLRGGGSSSSPPSRWTTRRRSACSRRPRSCCAAY